MLQTPAHSGKMTLSAGSAHGRSLLLYNGNFFRFGGKKHYTWVWIKNGMIQDAGYRSWEPTYIRDAEEAIDLKGNLVLPGFSDSHVHFVPSAVDRMKVNLNGSRNFEEIGQRLKDWVERHPQESTVHACCLEVSDLEEKRPPTRNVIDHYLRDYSVLIESRDFHYTVLNTRALHSSRVPFTMEGVELDERQRPTGIFRGKANAFLRRKTADSYSWEDKERAVYELSGRLLKKGVTSIHAMEGGYGFPESDAEFLASCGPKLPLDIAIYFGTTSPEKVKRLGLSRNGDLFLDGSFASGNAALLSNYEDHPGNGTLNYSQEELNSFLLRCYLADLDTSLHAVGNRAMEQALIAHEYARQKTGNVYLRHRIEHAELTTELQRKRAAALGLTFSMQPAFEYYYGGSHSMYAERLGERWRQTNPFREIRNAGIRICGGSDSGLTPVNPLVGIYAAVNPPVDENRLTIEEALSMFTRDAAWAVREEDYKGEIEIGKIADLTVTDRNIFLTNPKNIITAEIIMTIKSGSVLYHNL